MSELSRRLHNVDPQLKIISPRPWRWRHRQQDNWKICKGVICSKCSREVFRQKDGLCLPCWDQVNEIEVRLGKGVSASLDSEVLKEIVVVRKNSG